MFKVKMTVVLVCSLFLCSCALHNAIFNKNKVEQSTRNNKVPVYRTGIKAKDGKDGLLIENIDIKGAAYAAGLRTGDLMASINGKKMSKKEFSKFMHFNTGKNIMIAIIRNGQSIEYNVTPTFSFYAIPSEHKIYEMMMFNDKNVHLAVIVADIKNNAMTKDPKSWEDSEKHRLQANFESYMLNNFGKINRFSLVDRSRLDKIFEEYKVNLSGLISDDTRTQIGKMTGANYLLIISSARYPKGRDCWKDITTARLLEVESGKVLAVDTADGDCK